MTYVANMSYSLFPILYHCIHQTRRIKSKVLSTCDDSQVSSHTFTKSWRNFQALSTICSFLNFYLGDIIKTQMRCNVLQSISQNSAGKRLPLPRPKFMIHIVMFWPLHEFHLFLMAWNIVFKFKPFFLQNESQGLGSRFYGITEGHREILYLTGS